jgi:hypothetical protein
MVPRKKRRMAIIVSIIVLLLISIGVFILLYINTDMFKSDSKLFAKYIGQNIENVETIIKNIDNSEYNEIMQQSKYTTQTQIKVNYTRNLGTSLESTQNVINQLKLKINGQTDKSNQYNYQDINLLNNNETVSEVEYIQSGNTYGIRLSDLFNQYILVDNENLKELFEKIGYTEEELVNVPDTIELNDNLESIFQFSKEEKQTIKTKYINILNSNISKDNFSKQKNQIIQIDGENIKANGYVLTMTKEQLNNIYIKMLEELKQDEIILAKIDNIQTLLEKYKLAETINLREEFTSKVETVIKKITKNNIGQDEIKIIVYENNQKTVRTIIQHPDYEIYIDLLSSQTNNYIQVSYKSGTSTKEQVFTYKNTNEETSIVFKTVKDEATTEYNLEINEKVDDSNYIKNIVAKYEDESNRVEATIEQEVNIVSNFENEITLDNKNSVNLSDLEAEQVQAILNLVNNSLSEKTDEMTTNIITTDDLLEVLRTIGIVKEGQIIEAKGVTETERNRFNSTFEILQGENLEGEAILNIISAIKENLIDFEVVSDTELKLKLDTLNKNEEVADIISSFIEENKNKKYSAEVEYDETTGLASDILITILEE